MPSEHREKLYCSLVMAGIIIAIFRQRYTAFFFFLFLFPLSIRLFYLAWTAICKPDLRKLQVIRISIWVIAVTTVATVQYIDYANARNYADQIVSMLNDYVAKNGHYPASLKAIDVDEMQFRKILGHAAYYDGNRPSFFYNVTFIPFDTYVYDFDKSEWIYEPD